MDYKDRAGRIYKEDNSQDRILHVFYSNICGRYILKLLASKPISRIAGKFMDIWPSALLIDSFVKKNHINMKEYEKRRYVSYNQFFTRKIRTGGRKISYVADDLIAPCDGRLCAYNISLNSVFNIKGSSYTVASLLKNDKLAKEYAGGCLMIFRLTVQDYHRYCYIDDALKKRNKRINGRLYTVHPAIIGKENIYKENTREYCIMSTKNFGKVVQVEVGALFVGRIKNKHKEAVVKRGQEKGRFEFGGSTIVLMFQRDQIAVDEDIVRNTIEGYETRVHMGEIVGHSLY